MICAISFLYNSVRSQCESAVRGNMATSQHEGHANQLDLLIRAGNVSLWAHDLDTGAKVNARDMFFYRDRRALLCLVERRSNGGQSGSDHLGSNLHGVATRVIKPGLGGNKV